MNSTETGVTTSSLARKLSEIMAVVERIPKRGYNSFHKYEYATESDIVAAIRQEFARRQIILIPSVVSEERSPVGEKGQVLTSLRMKFAFFDGETGDNMEFEWMGFGTDKEDKGGYKAMTGGLKYFLLKTFLMPTGDDPEAEGLPQPEDFSRQPLSNEPPQANYSEPVIEPEGYAAFVGDLKKASTKGTAALEAAWKAGTFEQRKHVQATDREGWAFLKATAASVAQ